MCQVFPFLIHWEVVWHHWWSWRRWSIRCLVMWAMWGLPLLCYTPGVFFSIPSNLLNHRYGNSNSCKSNTHSLPQNPIDSMWSSCRANSEPVILSIKYVFVPKALLRYWISMTNPSLPSGVCLSNDCLLTILLICGVLSVWQVEVNRNVQVQCSDSPHRLVV